MKLNKITLIAAGALMFAASSCDDKWEPQTAEAGTVDLRSLGVNMSDAEKVTGSEISRATLDLSGYIVTISDKSGAAADRTYSYGDMPEVITLPAGEYTVTVESHKVQKAEWSNPYYSGSKDFKVEKSKITNIGVVTAAFSSLKVTVKFDENLKRVLGDDAKVTIISNDNGSLDFTPDETRSGYFEVLENSNSMVAHFEGTINGVFVDENTTFTDVVPGQHRIITYKAKGSPDIPGQAGQITPGGITLDTSIMNENISSNITTEEDLLDPSGRPGQEPEDPDNPDKPENPDKPDTPDKTITLAPSEDSPNLSLDDMNFVYDDVDFGNAIIIIKAEKGIKNLVVTIESDAEGFSAALADLYLAEPFDLAYPGKAEENLHILGLPYGTQVIDQSTVDFNITGFMPMLAPFKGHHKFTLSVTDNANITETKTLKFTVQ